MGEKEFLTTKDSTKTTSKYKQQTINTKQQIAKDQT